jgi:hypothetical protein
VLPHVQTSSTVITGALHSCSVDQMDPLVAIGLAGNIIAFLDLGAKLLRGAWDAHASLSGTTEENRSHELLVSEMGEFSSKLLAPDEVGLAGEEKQLCRLAEECRGLSTQLLDLLNKIKAKDRRSKRESLWSSVKNMYYEKDKQALEQRLGHCRAQLNLQLSYWTRLHSYRRPLWRAVLL